MILQGTSRRSHQRPLAPSVTATMQRASSFPPWRIWAELEFRKLQIAAALQQMQRSPIRIIQTEHVLVSLLPPRRSHKTTLSSTRIELTVYFNTHSISLTEARTSKPLISRRRDAAFRSMTRSEHHRLRSLMGHLGKLLIIQCLRGRSEPSPMIPKASSHTMFSQTTTAPQPQHPYTMITRREENFGALA